MAIYNITYSILLINNQIEQKMHLDYVKRLVNYMLNMNELILLIETFICSNLTVSPAQNLNLYLLSKRIQILFKTHSVLGMFDSILNTFGLVSEKKIVTKIIFHIPIIIIYSMWVSDHDKKKKE
jgi:hypothetical protein